jgi:hypothetical protein
VEDDKATGIENQDLGNKEIRSNLPLFPKYFTYRIENMEAG